MAHIVMAHIAMAYIVLDLPDGNAVAWENAASRSERRAQHGKPELYQAVHDFEDDSDRVRGAVGVGPASVLPTTYSYGLYSYGMYSYGPHSCGLYSFGLYSYGLSRCWPASVLPTVPELICHN